jgi:hypothetical protein
MEYLEHDLLIDSVLLVLIEHLAIIECKVLVLLLPLLRVQHLNQDVLYHRLNTIKIILYFFLAHSLFKSIKHILLNEKTSTNAFALPP